MTKKANLSEVDVMREVDLAFGGLQPDAQQRVLDWVISKYELRSKAQPSTPGPPEQQHASAAARKDIKNFMSEKQPENSYQRVACLVYYLEKFGGFSEVASGDIVKANADARLSRMTNPSLFIQHATHTYAYLTSLGKRKFAISARGEAVVEALPDHARVEEVHSRLPIRRKIKKSSRKGK